MQAAQQCRCQALRHACATSTSASSSVAAALPTGWRPQQQHWSQQQHRRGATPPSSSRAAVVVQAGGKGFGSTARKGFGNLLQRKDLWGGRQPLTPHKVSPMRPVPRHIKRPPYADSGRLPPVASKPEVHDAQGVAKMRAACKLAAQVLERAGALVQPGVATEAIDEAVHAMAIEAGAYPSPLNYGRFPKSVCTSVNEVMCHGIPDSRPLREGDIINIDVTVFLDGYHGDTSRTFYVGTPSPSAKALVEANEEALRDAIKICGPGVPVKAIGDACAAVAAKHKLTVVRDFIGHGVGRVFHADPQVMHHRNNQPGTMQVNQTFTIEPIFVEGSNKVEMWDDDWTATTTDGGLAAQCEHTVLITPSGCEVLTLA